MTPAGKLGAWGDQFVAVTDPLDMWLVNDGNYIRPATRQETSFVNALPALIAVVQEADHLCAECEGGEFTDGTVVSLGDALATLADALEAE